MTKIKKCAFALALVASTTLSGCGKAKGDLEFWSSFGGDYTEKLKPIVDDIADELGVSVTHVSKNAYDKILEAMVSAIATGKYPGVAVGYPDHFAQYHGNKILVPIDTLLSKDELSAFKEDFGVYLDENWLVDTNGERHLYGLPFNKSTELLGYNQVFVQYCYEKEEHDAKLLEIPTTWEEWSKVDDPNSNVSKYLSYFKDLVQNEKVVYAVQDENGDAHDFEESDSPVAGKVKVFDYKKKKWENTRLFTWDSTDNAFITLARQWKSDYTRLPEDQYKVTPQRRRGEVLFANNDNIDKTVDMLKFFNKLHKAHVFGTPLDFGGNNSFSSDFFKNGDVMFVVCSSGGMAHNTGMWTTRFKSTTIPYKTEDAKYVISQGANICMTNKANQKIALEFMKKLTLGEHQTKWCIDTGYYPASKASENETIYQEFLDSKSYTDELAVYKREGAETNHAHYSKESENWIRFVDDAFIGSAQIRSAIKALLPNVFSQIKTNLDDDAPYLAEIKDVLSQEKLRKHQNIRIDLADVLKD